MAKMNTPGRAHSGLPPTKHDEEWAKNDFEDQSGQTTVADAALYAKLRRHFAP